jgi:ferric-dicitrate binding protein FerR (iron transport regulator)
MSIEIENLLSSSLRTPPLPPEAMAAMRAAVQSEWRSGLTRRSRARVWARACAASLAAFAMLGAWQLMHTSAAFGTVQGESAGLVVYRPSLLGERRATDRVLRIGDRLEARADTLIYLPGVVSLRLRSGASVRIIAADEAELRAGAAYVDAGPAGSLSGLRVRTPLGLVEHLGTQFEVAWMDEHLRVRVREGAVRVAGVLRADAGEELILDAVGSQVRRELPAYDKEWNWVQSMPDALDVNGRSVMVLLRWVARETGRQLEFADDGAAQLAITAVLHGSISGLAPDLALRAMLATTSLNADVQTARIVVRSANTPPP